MLKAPVPLRSHKSEVLFEEADGGTLVTFRCEFEARGPGVSRAVGWLVRVVFAKTLDGLAQV